MSALRDTEVGELQVTELHCGKSSEYGFEVDD
jgi:hypothetical protein